MKETRFEPNSDLVIVRARVLRQFNYTIRSEEGRLLVEPVAAVVP